jgi:hypothetical protein
LFFASQPQRKKNKKEIPIKYTWLLKTKWVQVSQKLCHARFIIMRVLLALLLIVRLFKSFIGIYWVSIHKVFCLILR